MKTNIKQFLSLILMLSLTVVAYAQGNPGPAAQFDVIIRGGMVYDGTGRAPVTADVGIKGDRIAAVGNLSRRYSKTGNTPASNLEERCGALEKSAVISGSINKGLGRAL